MPPPLPLSPRRLPAAVRHLTAADPKLARVIAEVGPCGLRLRAEGTHFDAVARAIVYQQLSGKAAATIHGRIVALFGHPPSPAELLAVDRARLQACGLSRQKLGYLVDLAEKAQAGAVPFARLAELPDDEVIDALTCVKGVGVWTAQMFLLFRLGRPDVLPDTDLGIQNAVRKVYRLRQHPAPARVRELGAAWRPFASVAAWYLWRSLDGPAELP